MTQDDTLRAAFQGGFISALAAVLLGSDPMRRYSVEWIVEQASYDEWFAEDDLSQSTIAMLRLVLEHLDEVTEVEV